MLPCLRLLAAIFLCAFTSTGFADQWRSFGSPYVPMPDAISDGSADLEDLTIGTNFTVALLSDGSLRAWGMNMHGQCDLPSGTEANIATVESNSNHAVALTGSGEVLAWGDNFHGQTTVPLDAQSNVVAVTAGVSFSLALKADGSICAWGDNSWGQTTLSDALQSEVIAISAKYQHSLALKEDGSVVAWGYDYWGQATVPTEAESDVDAIAAGASMSYALKSDGAVIGWGNDANDRMNIPAAASSGIVAISAGHQGCLALNENGALIGWGDNIYGQFDLPDSVSSGVVEFGLGLRDAFALKSDGSLIRWGIHDAGTESEIEQYLSTSTQLMEIDGFAMGVTDAGQLNHWGTNNHGLADIPTAAKTGVAAFDFSYTHALARKLDNTVVSWGSASFGLQTIPVEAQSGVAEVAVGNSFSAVLLETGAVHAWGYTDRVNVPAEASAGVESIRAGQVHTLALKNDGSVLVWGQDSLSQLQIPTEAQAGVDAIAAGAYHSLALKDGGVLAWGHNNYGQSTVPAAAESGVIAIAAGYYHSLAIKSDGSLIAWGDNRYGQSLVPADANSGVIAVSASQYATYYLKEDSTVTVPDATLEAALRTALSIPTDPLTEDDLALLTELDLSELGVVSLEGLEAAVSLQKLNVFGNTFDDEAATWALIDALPLNLLIANTSRPNGDAAGYTDFDLSSTSGDSIHLIMNTAEISHLDLAGLSIDTAIPVNLLILQQIEADGVVVTDSSANVPPYAASSYEVSDLGAGELSFDASGSFDIDGSIASYTWTWPSGSASGINPSVTFDPGSVAVTLRVTDNSGGSAEVTFDAIVPDPEAPGMLDLNFGDDGLVALGVASGTSRDEALCVVEQGDGQLLVAGYSNSGSYDHVSIARLSPSGVLDTSFSSDGSLIATFGSYGSTANDIVVTPAGEILIVGHTRAQNSATPEFLLARFTSSGLLDTDFGSGGSVIESISGDFYWDNLYALALQTDGKILVAGYTQSASGYDFALVRYEADGSRDSDFGVGGLVVTDFGADDIAYDLVLQSDGKIVVAGSTNYSHAAMARYHTDGSLDTSFGVNGKVMTQVGGTSTEAKAVTLQADGKILLSGDTGGASVVLRYDSAGVLDTSYGQAGSSVLNISSVSTFHESYQIVNVSNDKTVLAGFAKRGIDSDMLLAAYEDDGTPCYSFGQAGYTLADFGSRFERMQDVIELADGSLLGVGRVYQAGTGGYDYGLVRVHGFTDEAATFTSSMELAGLTGEQAAPDATPFNDGVPNLLKYAFNMDMSGVDQHQMSELGTSGLPHASLELPASEEGAAHWVVRFVRRKGSELSYTPMKSTNLSSFVPMTGAVEVQNIDDIWERVIVREPCDPEETPSCFSRLSVSIAND